MLSFLSKFFVFTKSETRALLLLIGLIFFVFLGFFCLPFFQKNEAKKTTALNQELAAFEKEFYSKVDTSFNDYEPREKRNYYKKFSENDLDEFKKEPKPTATLFPFDPNTISLKDWMRLGLSEKQAAVILKYISKGGKFRKPEDILKIFVINEETKEKLLPYVKIEKADTFQKFEKKNIFEKNTEVEKPKTFQPYPKLIVDINTGDSTAFEKLRGIGPKLASRIIKLREELGGFYAISQLKDVWGMPDSTYVSLRPQFTISKVEIHKINLNKATYNELRAHPYIRGLFAKYILSYRRNNGDFKSSEQLLRVSEMTDSIYKKLIPYIVVE